jgi:anaerobic glycerol-3-phosphate dehydrogenase
LLKVGHGLLLTAARYLKLTPNTDAMLRPLDTMGRPAFEKLFTAGIILAHQNWTRMKCGSGLSVATAYGAVKVFSNLRT